MTETKGEIGKTGASEGVREFTLELRAAMEAEYDRSVTEFQPWYPKSKAIEHEQSVLQDILRRKAGAIFGKNCHVARGATVLTTSFALGDNSWVAAGAIIRGSVSIGANSTVNPYSHIAGIVKIGDGVRIAGHVSIYGFNHGISRTDVPIWRQKHTSRGIVIGDGTWIGANAVIVDGCVIGSHCVVAAGAIVTKSFPDYQIIGGNPARILRDRRANNPLNNL